MIYITMYCLVTIGSLLFVHEASKSVPADVLLILSTVIAVVFFHAVNFGKMVQTYKALFSMPKTYGLVMVSIFVIWLGTFFGASHMSASFILFAIFGGGAACVALATVLRQKTAASAIVNLPIVLVMVAFFGYNVSGAQRTSAMIAGGIVIAMALADYVYTMSSYKLAQKGLSGTQILAARFWVMFLGLIPLALANGTFDTVRSNYSMLAIVIPMSIITFIVPIFLYQKAVVRLGAHKSLLICATIPGLTLCAEWLLWGSTPFGSTQIMSIFSVALALAALGPMLSEEGLKMQSASSTSARKRALDVLAVREQRNNVQSARSTFRSSPHSPRHEEK